MGQRPTAHSCENAPHHGLSQVPRTGATGSGDGGDAGIIGLVDGTGGIVGGRTLLGT